MKKLTIKEYIFISALIIGGILIDQISKLIATEFLLPVESVPIIENVLHLTYVTNRGAAFGMLANSRWVFMIISTLAILAISAFLYLGKSPNKYYTVALAMVISGGIGNMIDRVALGYVVDFIDFCLINFAVFNIADSFVCVGAGMLILSLSLDIIKETKEKNKNDSNG